MTAYRPEPFSKRDLEYMSLDQVLEFLESNKAVADMEEKLACSQGDRIQSLSERARVAQAAFEKEAKPGVEGAGDSNLARKLSEAARDLKQEARRHATRAAGANMFVRMAEHEGGVLLRTLAAARAKHADDASAKKSYAATLGQMLSEWVETVRDKVKRDGQGGTYRKTAGMMIGAASAKHGYKFGELLEARLRVAGIAHLQSGYLGR